MRPTVAAIAVAAVLAGCGQAVGSTWTGVYRLPTSADPVSITVELHGRRATVSLGAGHSGPTAVAATLRGGRLRFTLPARPAPLVFDGGAVAQGTVRGIVSLRRGAAGLEPILGVYGSFAVVKAEGFAPWLVDLRSGDVHGLGAGTVGTLLGETRGNGTLRTGSSALAWTHGGAVERLARTALRQQEVRFGSLAGAGWIAPLAAAREPAIHWVELLVGPAVTTGEADYWAELAGEGLSPPSDSFPHLEAAVRAAGPSGFDPVPSLRRLAIPAHWIYGAADPNVPTQLCVESLEPIRAGHDFTWIVVPGMGHALLELPSGLTSSLPRSRGFTHGLFEAIVGWLRDRGLATG